MKNRVFHPGLHRPRSPRPPRGLSPPRHPARSDDAAYHDLAGDIVRQIAPHTEADPAALLLQLLVAAGNCIKRGPHYPTVEATPHYTNEFCILVGQSAKARKGTSYNWIVTTPCKWPTPNGSPHLPGPRTSQAAKGIIHHVRDDMPGSKAGESLPGIVDKRLLVVEEEMGGALAASTRKDNTLTATLRSAWDGKNLRTLAKNSHEIATAPHLSVIGHITLDELKAKLRGDALTNGFANRFLWIYTRRSRLLPDGGSLTAEDLRPLAEALQNVIREARTLGRLRRDPEADALWHVEYPRLSEERPGLLGAVTSRQEAHAIRLALIYAVLDRTPVIRAVHLQAALAVCAYALRSAEHCFGGLTTRCPRHPQRVASERREEGLTRTASSTAKSSTATPPPSKSRPPCKSSKPANTPPAPRNKPMAARAKYGALRNERNERKERGGKGLIALFALFAQVG